MTPIDFVTFAIIIDDIVFPNGRTVMGVLGGGGPQTAFGLRLWADRVGLVAGVGHDLPAEARAWLMASDIDTVGLRYSTEWPTLRAWQLLEADGRRTQVWRTPGPAIGPQLSRRPDHLPPAYQTARGVHLGLHPEQPDLDFIAGLRSRGMIVSLEPFREAGRRLSGAEQRALLSAGHIFSPNEAEAISMIGPGEPQELVHGLAAAGAAVVALRRGAAGALVHRADTGETWAVPAVDTTVIDPTGAGNAFCGGFLAGWLHTADLRLAGLYGAVAASFMVEQVGLPPPRPDLREEARRRAAELVARIQAWTE